MFRSLTLTVSVLLLALLGYAGPLAARENSNTLQVFILTGQSNMQGHAKIPTLEYLADDPATRPLYEQMVDPKTKRPRVIDGVWICDLTAGRNGDAESFGPLTAGYGARRGSQLGEKFGPEFSFGVRMREQTDQPVLLIKTAWGGKSLHTDFRPPSMGAYELSERERENLKKRGKDPDAEAEARRLQSGEFYRRTIAQVKRVLADPSRVCPAYDPKAGYELQGFVWFQGWNDLVASDVYPERGKPGGYDRYSECLAAFIRDVRNALDAPKLPFVIGVLGVDGPITNVSERYRKTHGFFRDAMAAPASMPEFQGNVAAVRTGQYWDMPLDRVQKKFAKVNQRRRELEKKMKSGDLSREEFDVQTAKYRNEILTEEEIRLRDRAASNAGYHYYGCGKTLALIGRAF
ncbi:MAG: sialate O-acetylesterase, partial [Planctomycetota bacterium]